MKSIIALLAVGLLAGGVVFFMMRGFGEPNEDSGPPKILKTEKDFRDKVAVLKRDRQKVLTAIEKLNERKTRTLMELEEKGVVSSADITNDKDVIYALSNLKNLKLEIAKLQSQSSKYDDAIGSIVAMLDQLDLDRIDDSIALDDEQLIQLRKIVVDLDERLGINENDIFAAEELGRILDDERSNEKK